MTNEEFERKMEFIVEQQAQFAVDIQQLRETHAQTEQLFGRLTVVVHEGFKDVQGKIDTLVDSHIVLSDSHRKVTEAQSRTYEGFKDVQGKIDALVDSHIALSDLHRKLTEAQSRTEETVSRLGQAQSRTEETVSKLGEAQSRTEETVSKLGEAQSRTDESLRSLTALVERYLRGRSNGDSRP